jgi:hypothetical protein
MAELERAPLKQMDEGLPFGETEDLPSSLEGVGCYCQKEYGTEPEWEAWGGGYWCVNCGVSAGIWEE